MHQNRIYKCIVKLGGCLKRFEKKVIERKEVENILNYLIRET